MDYFNKMDGAGGYVRASLLGFGQGMSPLHDPLRLHPALHSQLMDMYSCGQNAFDGRHFTEKSYGPDRITEAGKEGSGLLRSPLADYPPLPLLPFPHPNFLHTMHLDPRMPYGHFPSMKVPSSGTSTSTASLPGSAFAPLPPKVSKVEPDTPQSLFPHSMLLSSALEARNAFLGGRSPPLGPNNEDRRDSPSPMGSHGSRESPAQAREASTPTSPGEDMRARKPRPPGEYYCPVCARPLRAGEFEGHLTQELENITKHIFPRSSTPSSVTNSPLSNSPHLTSPLKMRDPGWETYQRVKANRQVRLRTKKRRSGRPEDDFHGLPHEDNQIEHCLRRQQNLPEEEEVDVEGDSSFEEYEWCGQRRVRVSSHMRQQQQPMQVNRIGESEPSKETLNNNSEKPRQGDSDSTEEKEAKEKERIAASEALQKELESLKEKVKSLERDAASSKFNCFVCDNAYVRPAVSMTCWHVFCEGCWPHSLETKSECPQCSSAFNSDDIRVIQL